MDTVFVGFLHVECIRYIIQLAGDFQSCSLFCERSLHFQFENYNLIYHLTQNKSIKLCLNENFQTFFILHKENLLNLWKTLNQGYFEETFVLSKKKIGLFHFFILIYSKIFFPNWSNKAIDAENILWGRVGKHVTYVWTSWILDPYQSLIFFAITLITNSQSKHFSIGFPFTVFHLSFRNDIILFSLLLSCSKEYEKVLTQTKH